MPGMSILLVELLPQGIIFGADRNISWSTERVIGKQTVVQNLGHTQRPKVLRWPRNKALLGYVGAAQIAGMPCDEWLYDFIGRNFEYESLETLAETLRSEVELQRKLDEATGDPDGLLIHLAGFERAADKWSPRVWFIRNVWGMEQGGYTDFRREFQKSEEVFKSFGSLDTDVLR